MRICVTHRINLFLIALFLLMPVSWSQDSPEENHAEVSLRMIGHQLLLKTGDQESRVLPIRTDGKSFVISFEKELAILPDDLISIIDSVLSISKIAEGYQVEVKTCDTNKVVHSYERLPNTNDQLPCRGRTLPKACYEIHIRLLGEINPVLEEYSEKPKDTSYASTLKTLIALGLLSVLAFYLYSRKRKSEANTNKIYIGQFQFDPLNTALVLGDQKIELTAKEADLLQLLHENLNETVEREIILNRVWGDEGDYVGRTLDVFISKLRKKLEADPEVKIVNVRGVGYRLVVSS